MTAAALTIPLPRYSGKEDPRDALPFFLWSTPAQHQGPLGRWPQQGWNAQGISAIFNPLRSLCLNGLVEEGRVMCRSQKMAVELIDQDPWLG